MDYIDLKYKPKKEDLVCLYRVEPSKNISFERAANTIALESSIGTWTDLITMNKEIKKLRARVFEINKKDNMIKVAYPIELFEMGNMPGILSGIAGNIFGIKDVRNLRLEDVRFPKKLIKSFKGPKFGIKGIRKLLRIKKRPLVGSIIKPKIGLRTKEHAKVAYEVWKGGLDIVKDDENLVDLNFNRFKDRVIETLKMRDKAEKETGERKVYMPNITAETNEMIKRAKFVKDNNGRYVMVDIISLGWSSLQTIRNENLGLVIHAHRAGHAALTRNKKHGISMLSIAKIARLIGVDQLHIGTVVGKMEGGKKEVKDIEEEIEGKLIRADKQGHILEQKWYNIKPVFAVASGGLHPGLVPKLVNILGNNIIMQFGGGVHGNPLGTESGARAVRGSVEAVMKNISLKEYSKKNKELEIALKKWKNI
nr:RuBisCO long chain, Form III-b [uncultured archaeon]